MVFINLLNKLFNMSRETKTILWIFFLVISFWTIVFLFERNTTNRIIIPPEKRDTITLIKQSNGYYKLLK